jgi:alcohol dehydrogenase class IV
MLNFEFATAGRILFGDGVVSQVGGLAAGLGQRVLLVTGSQPARSQPTVGLLEQSGLTVTRFTVADEPTVELVRQGVGLARDQHCNLVIGLGGGSVLDTAKAIAVLLTNPGDLLDYLEVIGRGQPLHQPSAPCIAIPTTAGTGSEVTRNAVLTSPAHRIKVSLRSPGMLPRLALVDPQLTHSLPPSLTAQTGLDALTQVMEPFVSSRANPLTDAFCREGLARAARVLRRVHAAGGDVAARSNMALASLLGGLALANAALGAVHGFAGPLGGIFHAPHGALCGCLLPHVMAANLSALRARAPSHPALTRYQEIACLLLGDPHANAEAGVDWVHQLCADLAIPALRSYGVGAGDFVELVAKAQLANSMKGNPLPLTTGELLAILEAAW